MLQCCFGRPHIFVGYLQIVILGWALSVRECACGICVLVVVLGDNLISLHFFHDSLAPTNKNKSIFGFQYTG